MKKIFSNNSLCYLPATIVLLSLLSGCDEQNGSNDTVDLATTLQNGGITWFSSEIYGMNEWLTKTLKYDELLFDGTNTIHTRYTRNTNGNFQPEPQSTKSFVLTSTGWQTDNNRLIVDRIDNNGSIILRDANEPLISKTLTSTTKDIADEEIFAHFKSYDTQSGWSDQIIEKTLFGMESTAYRVTIESLSDRYTMWDLNCEEEFGCNEIWSLQQPAESLADLSTGSPIDSDNLNEFKGAFLTWNQDSKPMLAVELVTDYSANFYVMESDSGIAEPSTASKSSSNTWQEKEVFGKKLFLIEIPKPLATDFGFNEDSRHIVLFEHNGKVRRGEYRLSGHTESFWAYNSSAKNDVIANLKQNDNNGSGNWWN